MHPDEEKEGATDETDKLSEKPVPFTVEMASVSARDIRRIVAKLKEDEDHKQP